LSELMLNKNESSDIAIYKAVRFEGRSHCLSQFVRSPAFLPENMRFSINEK